MARYRRWAVKTILRAVADVTGQQVFDSHPLVLLERRTLEAYRERVLERSAAHRAQYRRALLDLLHAVKSQLHWPDDMPEWRQAVEAISSIGRYRTEPRPTTRPVPAELKQDLPPIALQFVNHLQASGSRSARTHGYRVKHFFNWFHEDLACLSGDTLKAYMRHVESERTSRTRNGYRHPNTVSRYADTLRVFLQWAYEEGFVATPLWPALGGYRETHAPRAIPTDGEYARYFRLLADEPLWHRALKAVWATTGLRIAEILNIRMRDVDYDRQALRVILKGGREEWIAVTDDACALLQEYLAGRFDRGPMAPLWLTETGETLTEARLSVRERALREAAGWRPEVYGYHIFRHKYSEFLSRAPLRLDELKQQTRLASEAILQRVYAHASDDQLITILSAKGIAELLPPEEGDTYA